MSRAYLLAFAEEQRRKKVLVTTRRVMRDSYNPLLLPHNEFVAQFRLSKDGFGELCREVIPKLRLSKRITAVRDEIKVSSYNTLTSFQNLKTVGEYKDID